MPSHQPPQTANWSKEVLNATIPYRAFGRLGTRHLSSSKPKVSAEKSGPSEDWPPITTRPGGVEGSSEDPKMLHLSLCMQFYKGSFFGNFVGYVGCRITNLRWRFQYGGAGCHSPIILHHVFDPVDMVGNIGEDARCRLRKDVLEGFSKIPFLTSLH